MKFMQRYFPGLALRHYQKRLQLDAVKRSYEAIKTTAQRRPMGTTQSGDASLWPAGTKLRNYARHLDENHDLVIGILDVLVNNIVGTGIQVEPMVRQKNGKLNKKVNEQLRELFDDWKRHPDVTGELPFGELQRLVCRSWLRDGEHFVQHVTGTRSDIEHQTQVAYSLELLEADFVPFELTTTDGAVINGVLKNAWGKPTAYAMYKTHPGGLALASGVATLRDQNIKQVSADNITHIKFTRRVRQTRGVTVLHGILQRIDDIKDYEESERIAARVAAAFTGFIKKSGDTANGTNTAGDRTFEMNPGYIFDNLLPGEEVGTIASNRPNTQLQEFRNSQLRAAASGSGASYSSISKDYSGTYSSQRQELVESQPSYSRMREYFTSVFMVPVWERFVTMAVTQGLINAPASLDLASLMRADFRGPSMPWIDPKKEIEADVAAIEGRIKSRAQVIRERGGDPRVVDEQIEQDDTAPAAAGTDTQDTLRGQMETYGVGVRSGTITPQPTDEDYFRESAGLPEMSTEVSEAWTSDGGVRRPVTLQSGKAFDAAQEDAGGEETTPAAKPDEEQEGDKPEEDAA